MYGKKLLVESDHKPLETFFKKPLYRAPSRLQRIIFDVLQYSPKVVYVKGTQIPIADILSRDSLCENEVDDIRAKDFEVNLVLTMSANAKTEMVRETAADCVLNQLIEIIQSGWPNNKKMC